MPLNITHILSAQKKREKDIKKITLEEAWLGAMNIKGKGFFALVSPAIRYNIEHTI